jgi:hypothetical protein
MESHKIPWFQIVPNHQLVISWQSIIAVFSPWWFGWLTTMIIADLKYAKETIPEISKYAQT